MKGRQLVLCTLLLTTMAVAGNEADPGKRLVDEFVSEMVTMQGNFEQALIDPAGEIIERTSGRLEIQRPGQFRWAYVEPYEQWLIADGLNIWSYDLDLEQVTVKPQAEALANTPALLLGGAEDALEQFEYQGSYAEKETLWVRLQPKNTESGFLRVELGFMNDVLQRMVFFDNLDQTTLVSLYDVRVNETIDAGQFEFVVPEDVDLVGTPVVADVQDP